MSCKSCIARIGKNGGEYHVHCIECCVALVASARPDKKRAAAMLAAIERIKGAPSRDAILDRVKNIVSGKNAL